MKRIRVVSSPSSFLEVRPSSSRHPSSFLTPTHFVEETKSKHLLEPRFTLTLHFFFDKKVVSHSKEKMSSEGHRCWRLFLGLCVRLVKWWSHTGLKLLFPLQHFVLSSIEPGRSGSTHVNHSSFFLLLVLCISRDDTETEKTDQGISCSLGILSDDKPLPLFFSCCSELVEPPENKIRTWTSSLSLVLVSLVKETKGKQVKRKDSFERKRKDQMHYLQVSFSLFVVQVCCRFSHFLYFFCLTCLLFTILYLLTSEQRTAASTCLPVSCLHPSLPRHLDSQSSQCTLEMILDSGQDSTDNGNKRNVMFHSLSPNSVVTGFQDFKEEETSSTKCLEWLPQDTLASLSRQEL